MTRAAQMTINDSAANDHRMTSAAGGSMTRAAQMTMNDAQQMTREAQMTTE